MKSPLTTSADDTRLLQSPKIPTQTRLQLPRSFGPKTDSNCWHKLSNSWVNNMQLSAIITHKTRQHNMWSCDKADIHQFSKQLILPVMATVQHRSTWSRYDGWVLDKPLVVCCVHPGSVRVESAPSRCVIIMAEASKKKIFGGILACDTQIRHVPQSIGIPINSNHRRPHRHPLSNQLN
jgi:hypothetical protein